MGLVIAGLWFIAATVLVPTRVTFGAGSLRCGTVVAPANSEIGRFCPEVTGKRLREAWWTTGVLVVAAALPAAGRVWMARSRAVRAAVTIVLGGVWLLGIPLMLFFITGSQTVQQT